MYKNNMYIYLFLGVVLYILFTRILYKKFSNFTTLPLSPSNSNCNIELYLKNFYSYKEKIIYDFNTGDGGIGNCILFFIAQLGASMKNNKQLYYKKNNIDIEKYIKLRYDMMYINEDMITQLDSYKIIKPQMLYSSKDDDYNYNNYNIDYKDVFYFTDEVKINSKQLFPQDISNYISIHIRLGDKYLETDKNFVVVKDDQRNFSEENLYKFIEKNYNENIFFCCDNNNYKLKIKEKYNNIIIANTNIGHTSLSNTNSKQILDAITEIYILSNSKLIYSPTLSTFSIVASKFNNIPLINQ